MKEETVQPSLVVRIKRYMPIALVLVVCVPAGCGKSDSGSASGPTVGATGAVSSTTTVQAIQQKIAAEKDLAGADIKVSQASGSIQLDGTVASQAQKDKAEEIVTSVQKEKNQQVGVFDNLLIKAAGGESSGGK